MPVDINIQSFAVRVATESKALRTLLNGNQADLAGLSTTAKGNLVSAVNEVLAVAQAAAGAGGAAIDDTTASTTKVYSSSKVNSQIADARAALKSELLGGAGAAFDTLKELYDLLQAGDQADQNAITALNTALGNRVRFDAAQTLTTAQKVTANANMGSLSLADFGSTTTNYVTIFEAGLV